MGMLGVKYIGFYEENLFVTSSTNDPMIENYMAVAFSVAHTALHDSAEQHNDRTTNGSTFK